MKVTNCPRCLFDSKIASFKTAESQCEYCDLHDKLESQANPEDFKKQLEKLQGNESKYNCLIGISGGLDSSTLLWMAVREWGLRPLVIHFDNGWNTPEAEHNMDTLVRTLKVDFIRYKATEPEYRNICDAFLCAGVLDADIPNDIAMTKLMYDTAHQFKIKHILNGHNFRQEGSTPKPWTYMDAKYIRSVYGKPIKSFPLFTFWDQILASFRGIVQIRPFHYIKDYQSSVDAMRSSIGFKWYGHKHGENFYTDFVGSKLLPEKFDIDKRRVYLSARMRSGMLTREQAMEELATVTEFDMEKLGHRATMIAWASQSEIQDRSNFDRYNFKRLRPIIWILAKLKVVPYTFYKKYCF